MTAGTVFPVSRRNTEELTPMKSRLMCLLALMVVASTAFGQQKKTELETYLDRVFPRCPGGAVAAEQIQSSGPHGFVPYRVRFTSTEKACGRETFALLSPSTRQIIVGDIFSVPADPRR